jgi:HK97 family phage major capsid protein
VAALIHTLRAKRSALKTEGDGIAALAAEAGEYTQEQMDRLGVLEAQMSSLDAQIGMEERRQAWERDAPAVVIEEGSGAPASAHDYPTPFKSLGEQLLAVYRSAQPGATFDRGLAEIHAAALGSNEAIGADGGFLVQKDLQNELLSMVHDTGVLAAKANHIPIGPDANGLTYNQVAESSRANSSRWGGISIAWLSENQSLTAARPTFRPSTLTLGKLGGLWYATEESLRDVVSLQAVATQAFTEEFGFVLDDTMIRGTGGGMPLGILNAPGTVSVSKNTGQAAATFDSENAENMYVRMAPRSRGNASWYINVELYPQIWRMAQSVGTGGFPLFRDNVVGAPNGTLLGRPIVDIEQCSAAGTVGDVIFADWSRYDLIEKGGITTATSIHVAFLTDEQAFRWIYRVNGQPHQTTPTTAFKGSNTTSPFITLATRA